MFNSIMKKTISRSSGTGNRTAGIGIVFKVGPDNGMYIEEISVGGSAEECKILRKGDCLVAVDGKDVYRCEEPSVSSCVLGKFGTSVSTVFLSEICYPVHRAKICKCFRQVALKFRRNVITSDGSPFGKNQFVYISPCLIRGKPGNRSIDCAFKKYLI